MKKQKFKKEFLEFVCVYSENPQFIVGRAYPCVAFNNGCHVFSRTPSSDPYEIMTHSGDYEYCVETQDDDSRNVFFIERKTHKDDKLIKKAIKMWQIFKF